MSALHDHTVALGCIRHALPSHYGKGAEQLPDTDRWVRRLAVRPASAGSGSAEAVDGPWPAQWMDIANAKASARGDVLYPHGGRGCRFAVLRRRLLAPVREALTT